VNRRQFVATVGTAGITGVAGCEEEGSDSVAFRVGAGGFERSAGGSFEPFAVRGVNLGMAKPGRFPGEAAITRSEYDRWLDAIGAIANAVRVYTIHPPAFYRALAAYNENASEPLLLLQGTWVTTSALLDAGDATTVSATVDAELERTVDVVHGETTLPERPGRAAGTYDADVSDYTCGFLFGIEWPPAVVETTNNQGGPGEYEGEYLRTEGGSPFEQWLAGRMDGLVTHEEETYRTQRPVSFVNWVTTDPLNHPYEPFRDEDAVSVDPDSIVPTASFTAGTVASYHVYPYYPDLLNETPQYTSYLDHRGEKNSYAGYLDDLVGSTDQPVLIAEFGVPSSRGIAHRSVHGRDQGRNTEQEQGEEVAAMVEDIERADTAGWVLFSWQDEWFKRTWNLAARSVPGRRPHWSNVETPEQRFGLLSFDPIDGVMLDGSTDGWTDARTVGPADPGDTRSTLTLTQLAVTHDIEGLNYRVEFEELPDPVDWTRMNTLVTVGLTGQSRLLPLGTDAETTADFVVHLAGENSSRLLVDSSYDAFAREFGEAAGLSLDTSRDGTAGFVPVRELISRAYTVPATGERRPPETVETGRMRFGNGNPESPSYDSLTDVHVDSTQNSIEGRIPWILLNVADPSTKQRIATDSADGLSTVPFDEVRVSAVTFTPDESGQAAETDGVTNLTHQIPGRDGSTVHSVGYGWEPWSRPDYAERLKQSYYVLRERL
jgi:hypothetical protein